MITFFCIPKAFCGSTAALQRAALRSWKSLHPACEIFVFGNEEGVADACNEAGARHFPEIPRNEFGTPLLDYAFRETARNASNPLLCYANSDILFFPDLISSAQILKGTLPAFLAIGRKWNFDAFEESVVPVGEENKSCEVLKETIRSRGVLHNGWYIDYFLYPKQCFPDIPPFAVGRPAWDNWMIYHARCRQIPVVDATEAIFAGHQNHDYTHTAEGKAGGQQALWQGPEAMQNRKLAGWHLFMIDDATHQLCSDGALRRRWKPWHFLIRFREAHEIYPRWRWVLLPLRHLIKNLRSKNHRFRLFALRHGIDLFPNKDKRRPPSSTS